MRVPSRVTCARLAESRAFLLVIVAYAGQDVQCLCQVVQPGMGISSDGQTRRRMPGKFLADLDRSPAIDQPVDERMPQAVEVRHVARVVGVAQEVRVQVSAAPHDSPRLKDSPTEDGRREPAMTFVELSGGPGPLGPGGDDSLPADKCLPAKTRARHNHPPTSRGDGPPTLRRPLVLPNASSNWSIRARGTRPAIDTRRGPAALEREAFVACQWLARTALGAMNQTGT